MTAARSDLTQALGQTDKWERTCIERNGIFPHRPYLQLLGQSDFSQLSITYSHMSRVLERTYSEVDTKGDFMNELHAVIEEASP